jgi:hypothetical protein
MPVNAMLAELDQDIATRHALGGHGAVHVRPRTPNPGLVAARSRPVS